MKERVASVFAGLIYGAYAGGYADELSAIDALIITESKKITLRCLSEQIMNKRARLLIVDKSSFEGDIKHEHFGGLFSENLVTYYEPIIGAEYLRRQEIIVKKRIIDNTLRNLVLGFPEMSRNFLIKPEYFMYEYFMRRSTIFPPISYRFLNMLEGEKGKRNVSAIMEGFKAAIGELANERLLCENGGFLKISEEYIEEAKEKRSLHLVELFSTVRANVIRHVFRIFPEIRESLSDESRIYKKRHLNESFKNPLKNLEDPRKYIFVPTTLGIIPFTEKLSIRDFVSKYASRKTPLKPAIKRLGSFLSSVYILKFSEDGGEKKFIAKIFKDWYGWKWFPIALWTFGTRNFAVLGRTRLEKEYAINRFLHSHGINVPAIVYVNPEEKVIIQEYVEGTVASKIIERLGKASDEERKRLLEMIWKIGREIANVHRLGISIGDSKPENILVAHDGRIFFVDLEQADRRGDQAWDIAEFLYYSGHYVLLPTNIIEEVTRRFIDGYVSAGGDVRNIKRALSLKYIRVFSFFTPPHVILTIVNSCKDFLRSIS